MTTGSNHGRTLQGARQAIRQTRPTQSDQILASLSLRLTCIWHVWSRLGGKTADEISVRVHIDMFQRYVNVSPFAVQTPSGCLRSRNAVALQGAEKQRELASKVMRRTTQWDSSFWLSRSSLFNYFIQTQSQKGHCLKKKFKCVARGPLEMPEPLPEEMTFQVKCLSASFTITVSHLGRLETWENVFVS